MGGGGELTGFHLDFTSMSLRFHFDLTSVSFRFHFDFTSVTELTSISLRLHFDVTSVSPLCPLQSYFPLTSIPLRFHFDVTSISPRVHFDVTSMSLRFHFDFKFTPMSLEAQAGNRANSAKVKRGNLINLSGAKGKGIALNWGFWPASHHITSCARARTTRNDFTVGLTPPQLPICTLSQTRNPPWNHMEPHHRNLLPGTSPSRDRSCGCEGSLFLSTPLTSWHQRMGTREPGNGAFLQ